MTTNSVTGSAIPAWCERYDLDLADVLAWKGRRFADPKPVRRGEKRRQLWLARAPATNAAVDTWHRWLIEGGYSPAKATGMLSFLERKRERDARENGERRGRDVMPKAIADVYYDSLPVAGSASTMT